MALDTARPLPPPCSTLVLLPSPHAPGFPPKSLARPPSAPTLATECPRAQPALLSPSSTIPLSVSSRFSAVNTPIYCPHSPQECYPSPEPYPLLPDTCISTPCLPLGASPERNPCQGPLTQCFVLSPQVNGHLFPRALSTPEAGLPVHKQDSVIRLTTFTGLELWI